LICNRPAGEKTGFAVPQGAFFGIPFSGLFNFPIKRQFPAIHSPFIVIPMTINGCNTLYYNVL
jgi:hypothetical protein